MSPAEPSLGIGVTTILLTYRHESDVAEALRSILEQELDRPHEVLVVDDASDDRTVEVARSVAADHPDAAITVLAGATNLGVQRNLRRALEAATGAFVALLEGDDRWTDPRKLADQLAYLDDHPDAVAVGHLTRILVDDVPTDLLFGSGLGTGTMVDVHDVVASRFPHVSSLVFRRAALPTTPAWFDGLAAADWSLAVLLALQAPIGVLRRELSDYRKNDRSSWTPRPTIERKQRAIDGVAALRRNLAPEPSVVRSLRREEARLHLVVVALAVGCRRPVLAVVHGARAVACDPGTVLRRTWSRLRRR